METSISTETLEVRADYQSGATSDGSADGDGKAKREQGRDDLALEKLIFSLASFGFYLQGSRRRSVGFQLQPGVRDEA